MEQEIGVRVKGDIAERGDDRRQAARRISEFDVLLGCETLDVANVTTDVFKYLLPRQGLRSGRLGRNGSQQGNELSHLDHVGLIHVLRTIRVGLTERWMRLALRQMLSRVKCAGYTERSGAGGNAQFVELRIRIKLEEGNHGGLLSEFSGTNDSVFVRDHICDAGNAVGLGDSHVSEDGGVRNIVN